MSSTSHPKASAKDFRVAIIGGGMCGLACAVGLARVGIQSDVFEAAPKFDEVGAGVGLGPNALRALKGLGILDTVLARVDDEKLTDRRMLFVSGPGAHEEVYDYNHSSQFTAADTGLGIYRPAFLDALLPLMDPNAAHFNKRCTSISTLPSGVNRIHFADGTTHDSDLVIGADGIRSTSRSAVVGEDRVLQFTNTVAYRGLVPMEALLRDGVKTDLGNRVYCFVGIDKHIISFPIKSGKIVNIVAFSTDNSVPVGSVEVTGPWVRSVSQQELLDKYEGWGPDAMVMLSHLKTPSKWFIHALAPLKTFIRGKIALVGDAAHGMPPHLGSGVGQGFEDVFVLCQLLGHPSTNLSNLEEVLKAYDAVRQPRANMVLERSFRAGIIYEGYGKPGYGADDMEGHLAGIWEPIWRHDLDGDVATAIASLTERGSVVD
ncbi:FAD/NAD-P-binding domain-containing protein [Mycena galericulata]|nr:FAD/NAD-P-binding domain-containing protein [Mycena galericulata]